MLARFRDDRGRSSARTLVVSILAMLVFCLGGAHLWVNGAAAFGLGLIVAGLYLTERRQRRRNLGPFFLVALIAAVAVLFQIVPLPAPIVALLSPERYALTELPGTEPHFWMPLTVDTSLSSHELIKILAALFATILGVELYTRRPQQLWKALGAMGCAVFLLGLVHLLAGWDGPYGVYGGSLNFPTSFINPNHQAGFLGFAAFLSIAAGFGERNRTRWVWFSCAILCATGMVLSLSRGGILALLLASLLLAVSLAVRERISARHFIAVQFGVALVLLLVGALAYSQVVHELWTLGDERAFSKAEVWAPFGAIVSDYWLTGLGRGAQRGVYWMYQTVDGYRTFTHLENEWLQIFVDFGVLVGGLIFVLILRGAVVALKRLGNEPDRLAAFCGLFFLAVANLADFSATLGAILIPAAMVASILVSQPHRRRVRHDEARLWGDIRLRSRVLGTLAVGGVVVAAVAYSGASRADLERDTQTLNADKVSPDVARKIISRHPGDGYLASVAGAAMLRRNDEKGARDSLPWLNRAMILTPESPLPHRLAAEALWLLGAREQAFLEYRLAAARSASPGAISKVVADLSQDAVLLESYVGSEPERRVELAYSLLNARAFDSVRSLLADPSVADRIERHEILARVALQERDYEAMASHAKFLLDEAPAQDTGYLLLARATSARGNRAGAVNILQRGIDRIGPSGQLMTMVASELIALERYVEAREVAKKLLDRTARPGEAAQAHSLLGRIYLAEGLTQRALREFERGRDRMPDNIGLRRTIATLREQIGDVGGARDELLRIVALDPDATWAREKLQALSDRRDEARERAMRERYLAPGP